jgi:hypothetical protein
MLMNDAKKFLAKRWATYQQMASVGTVEEAKPKS